MDTYQNIEKDDISRMFKICNKCFLETDAMAPWHSLAIYISLKIVKCIAHEALTTNKQIWRIKSLSIPVSDI